MFCRSHKPTVETAKIDLHKADLFVLGLIGLGLIVILLSIIAGLFLKDTAQALPNWAENVLVSVATAAALKLGDVLASLVALANGRQLASLGQQLGQSTPIKPHDAQTGGGQGGGVGGDPLSPSDAAAAVAEAAGDKADSIIDAEQGAGDGTLNLTPDMEEPKP